MLYLLKVGGYMKKGSRVSKKAKRRMFLATTLLFGIIGVLFVSLYGYWTQIYSNVKQTNKLKVEYKELSKKQTQLKADATKLQDPDYIARYARETYLYSKDGEKIIRIVE